MSKSRHQSVAFAEEPETLPTYEELIARTMVPARAEGEAGAMQNPPAPNNPQTVEQPQTPPAEPEPKPNDPDQPQPANPEPPREQELPEPDLDDPDSDSDGGAAQPAPGPRDLAAHAKNLRRRKNRAADDPAIVDAGMDGEIITPAGQVLTARYESRITVLAAWQYPGNVNNAPDWIDRNWIGYETNFDPVRQLDPGPVVRIPLYNDPTRAATVRVGDYVVQQEIKLASGLSDVRIEAWARDHFEKFFVPRGQLS